MGEKEGCWKNKMGVSKYVRRWLYEKKGHECEICKNSKWLEKPIPLMVDHIDGNSDNNRPENIRLICGNCNMLLPTFAGANKGNGREYRRSLYTRIKFRLA